MADDPQAIDAWKVRQFLTYAGTARNRWDTGLAEGEVCSLTLYGGYIYAGLIAYGVFLLLKIDPSTMTEVGRIDYDGGYLTSLGGYIYAGLGTSPAIVVKLDLEVRDAITLVVTA